MRRAARQVGSGFPTGAEYELAQDSVEDCTWIMLGWLPSGGQQNGSNGIPLFVTEID